MLTKSTQNLRTPFGLKGDEMLTPAEVESGLDCGCTCPGCGDLLVAKKGGKRAWHFAHYNKIPQQSCFETALHAMAKQVLKEAKWLRTPEKRISMTRHLKSGETLHREVVLRSSGVIRFDDCKEEVWESSLRTDVVGYRGDRRLLVEMFVTNEVDKDKRRKLEEMGLPAIEIDLSSLGLDAGLDAVRMRVLEDAARKKWLFFPGEAKARAELRQELDKEAAEKDKAYEQQLEAERQAKQRKKERKLQDIETANQRYRSLPTEEKGRRLREELGIQGDWPVYLNQSSAEAQAISEPPHIWQAALFHRFVFGRRHFGKRLTVDVMAEWVVGRCGLVDNRPQVAHQAVGKYLEYLKGSGFLVKPYNPYEGTSYEVVHDKLELPPEPHKKKSLSTLGLEQNNSGTSARKPIWIWRASWPDKEGVFRAANTMLADSQYRESMMQVIEGLFPRRDRYQPLELAEKLEHEHGMPTSFTLETLKELGFVLS